MIIDDSKEKNKNTIFIMRISFIIIIISFLLSVFSNKFEEYDKEFTINLQKIITIYHIFFYFSKLLNNHIFYSFIIIIIDNFTNIYITFLLFIILYIGNYISFILKLGIKQIPPYLSNNDNIKIYDCGLGWGLPSTEIIIYVPFIFIFYEIMNIYKDSINKTLKKIIQICLIIYLLFMCIGNIVIGKNYLSQIFISFLFGIGISLFIASLNINLKNGSILYSILKKTFLYLIVNIILIIIAFVIYIYNINSSPNKIEKMLCKPIQPNNNINYFNEKNGYVLLINGSFLFLSIFIVNIFLYISLKMYLVYILENDLNYFMQFNFNDSKTDLNKSTFSISIDKDTKWNKTSIIKTIIRLFISLILYVICFLPYYFIKWNENIFIVFSLKFCLSNILFYIGYFFVSKIFYIKFHLINYTLFAQIEKGYDTILLN